MRCVYQDSCEYCSTRCTPVLRGWWTPSWDLDETERNEMSGIWTSVCWRRAKFLLPGAPQSAHCVVEEVLILCIHCERSACAFFLRLLEPVQRTRAQKTNSNSDDLNQWKLLEFSVQRSNVMVDTCLDSQAPRSISQIRTMSTHSEDLEYNPFYQALQVSRPGIDHKRKL